jgi:secreted trypsin-like serine protease
MSIIFKGDGGGPLVCPKKDDKNRYVQVGIVSWGIGCGKEVPGVYASVQYFSSWISKHLS